MDHVFSFFNCNQRAGCFTTNYCYQTLHSRLLAIHRLFSFFSLKAAHLYWRSCCRLGATPAPPPASAGSLGVTPSVGSGQASFFSKPKNGFNWSCSVVSTFSVNSVFTSLLFFYVRAHLRKLLMGRHRRT